jgi:D-alanyl-D-alanine carboxypeptidase/D-alanyl-D-alanine-endopeptidase (penicillin-binding protein 4)
MNRIKSATIVVTLLFSSARLCADLTSDVNAILRDKVLAKADVGVQIVRLGSTREKSTVVFRHNSDTPLIPASNLKIATSSAFLEKLGPDFKFRTLLLLRGEDLVLVGDGDPTLGDAEMLRKTDWDVNTLFIQWAELLKKQHITAIRNVIVDDSVFDEEFVHPNWSAKQQHLRYVAQVGGVNLNSNCLDFFLKVGASGETVGYSIDPATQYASIRNTCQTGRQNSVWLSREPGGNAIILRGETNASNSEPISVTIHDPPMFAATVLAETLKSNGVTVSGQVQRDRTIRAPLGGPATAPTSTVVAVYETPLSKVLARANKDSMNLYAECLCKRLGFEAAHEPGSWLNGTAAVKAFLKDVAGVNENEFSLDDGCGLSRENRISPNALTQTLAHNFTSSHREQFVSSLAVGGVDGTLEKRFLDDLRGRVFAKSGFINNVSCLSGYVKTRGDQWYAFSIMMNSVGYGAKQLQEKIVKAIDSNTARNLAGDM